MIAIIQNNLYLKYIYNKIILYYYYIKIKLNSLSSKVFFVRAYKNLSSEEATHCQSP